MESRNVFIYWVGKEYTLISVLRNLMYLHSSSGKGYKVNFITDKNIHEFVKDIPKYFHTMHPAHQADFVRVNVICEHGGIWLDSDTIVLDSLDSIFDWVETKSGFFIKENNEIMLNGVFGSKPNTQLMMKLRKEMIEALDNKQGNIELSEIGCNMLQTIYNANPSLYDDYIILNGLENVYPAKYDTCENEFLLKPYDNYKTLVREFQPFIVLANSVYTQIQNMTEQEILQGNMPLNYFISKSFQNMKLVDLDFIEIGTCNFDTLIQNANDSMTGISVDAVKYYIDNLPNKANVKKMNVGISNINSTLDVYYIPEKEIEKHKLAGWFKGCNCINRFHPLHVKHNVTHLCVKEKVQVIPTYELFYKNKVRNVKYLKIDTEGHDCIILKTLYMYIKGLPNIFYPNKILFESNENTPKTDVIEIINLFCSIGYKLISSGYDTIIEYDRETKQQ